MQIFLGGKPKAFLKTFILPLPFLPVPWASRNAMHFLGNFLQILICGWASRLFEKESDKCTNSFKGGSRSLEDLELLFGGVAENGLPPRPLLLEPLGRHSGEHLVVLLQSLSETLPIQLIVSDQIVQPDIQVLQLLPGRSNIKNIK